MTGGGGVVKCKGCIYVQPDPTASERNWTAFKCGNPESEFEGALLNVTLHGGKMNEVAWSGCKYGTTKQQVESA